MVEIYEFQFLNRFQRSNALFNRTKIIVYIINQYYELHQDPSI